MKSKYLFLILLVFLLGCESRAKKNQKRVDGYIQQARRLVKQQTLLKWFNIVHNKPMNIAETYDAHRELFSLQNIDFVNYVHQETRDEERVRELLFFRNYLIQGYEITQNFKINKQIEDILTTPLVLNGKKYLLLRFDPQIATLQQLKAFQKEFHSYRKTFSRLQELILKRVQRQNSLAGQLGYPNAIEMSATLRHLSLIQLKQISKGFLEASDSLYTRLLEEMSARHLNKKKLPLSLSDIFYLKTPREFDGGFNSENMESNMKWYLGGLNIDLNKQKNLKLYLATNPEILFGAYCAPVEISTDVRLAVSLSDGFTDFLNYFGEMGRAQHFLHEKTNRWVFQVLGPGITQQLFVELFRNVLGDTLLLNNFVPFTPEERQHYMKYWQFRQLLKARHLTALYMYEFEIYSGVENLDETYQQLMERALKIKLHPEEFYWDIASVGGFFRQVDQLQAIFLTPMVEDFLINQFGEKWFKNPETTKWFQKIWEKGDYWLLPELLKKTGNQELSVQPFLQRFSGD